MGKKKAAYKIGSDVLDPWRDDLLVGKPPVLYPIGEGEMATIEVGPGRVNLIGGAPGAGKTAFTMQATLDALRLTKTLRVVVCNVEMTPETLLDRQLARLSGVDLTTIRYRKLGREHADRIDQGLSTLATVADRLCFLRPPFDLSNVAAAADEFEADLLLLDYIQRIPPPGRHENRRGLVDATMNYLRQFADTGVAVVVVAAVARTKDKRGRSSYDGDGLNLASFRESSELEFGADDAFILVPNANPKSEQVWLKHLKARYGETRDILFNFDRPRQYFQAQSFTVNRSIGRGYPTLAASWDETALAPGGNGDGE
ncbi:MAG: AAA family ATPase [Phycisphaerales bacterium]|nr:AAA family ATPase [Phycisphaerales bacterium]